MTTESPQDLLKLAVEVAEEAARLIVERRRGTITVADTKSTITDVVTAVDRESEELIRARVLQARPDDSFLGEEGDDVVGTSGVRWVVDPIDGTVNYLYGLPWYAVSVAVARDGVALAGAVVEPASGRVWSASEGGGASLDGRPLRASSASRLDLSLIGTGFSYSAARRARQGRLAGTLLARVRDIRRAGSASLDLCAVAAGWLDGYYEHAINPWDWAAGALIAREAGAIVSAPDPAAPYGDAIVAATPGIHAELAGALVELGGGAIP